jgi:hypothetical protein
VKKIICRLFGHDMRPTHAVRSGTDVMAQRDRVTLWAKCPRCDVQLGALVPLEYSK